MDRIKGVIPARPPRPAQPARGGGGYQIELDRFPSPVWIEIDLSAIRENLQGIRRLIGPRVKLLAVVKANAYGHGMVPMARALVESDVDFLGVASVVEGITLRQQGVRRKILVLGQHLPEESPLVVQQNLIQAVGDWQSAKALARAAAEFNRPVSIHLKVDTGMSRYGVWHEEALTLARRITELPGLRMEGTMTHLSMAGQNADVTHEQIHRFSSALYQMKKERLPTGIQHAANSIGLLRFPGAQLDLVRTGLLVYGASPLKEGQLPFNLKPALSLKSRVRALRTIHPGQTVSYGGTFQANRATRVATIPVGYAHGYSRALSNRAELLIREYRARVIGRVTMQDLMADVTDIPGVEVGDEAVLLGRQGEETITAAELARHARTIPYEILAGLSSSIPRRYVN